MKKLSISLLLILAALFYYQPSYAAGKSVEATSARLMQNKPSTINMNTADATQIAEVLSGIGLAKAKAIVDYRKEHGNFKSLEDLAMVKGIGIKTITKNQNKIVFK